MARIRSVKPEIWTDPDFCDLSLAARLFFIGTFNFADDWGLLVDDPRRLKLQIFPADSDIDPLRLVEELIEARFLVRVTAPDGSKLLQVRTFLVHQKIDKRAIGRWGNPAEWPSSLPIPPHPHQSPPAPPLEGKGRERISNGASGTPDTPTQPPPPSAAAETYEADFAAAWKLYPRKTERKAALHAYRARRRAGASSEEMLNATRHYAEATTGTEQRFIKRGQTFYGPNEPWRDWIQGNPEHGQKTANTGEHLDYDPYEDIA